MAPTWWMTLSSPMSWVVNNPLWCRRGGFNPWVRKIPWRRKWQPTPVFFPGQPRGQRSQVGCSPWGLEESDTTERLHFHFSLSCLGGGNGNPLQCSCLENPRDRGAWWAAVYGAAQSQTRLKRLSSSSSTKDLPRFSWGLNRIWSHPWLHLYTIFSQKASGFDLCLEAFSELSHHLLSRRGRGFSK